MFGIIGGLLGGWILALFGFENVVIHGMAQFFGLSINMTGYYFLFGMAGMLGNIMSKSRPVNFDLKDKDKNKK